MEDDIMATRLKKLRLNEISLVGDGANPGARVLLYKSEDEFKPCADCKDPKGCAIKKGCAVDKTGTSGDRLATSGSGNNGGDIQKETNMSQEKNPATSSEDIQKMVSEAVTKALAAEREQHQLVVKELTGSIEKMKSDSEERDRIAKAKTLVTKVAGLDETLVVKGLLGAGADTVALIEKMADLAEGALKQAKAFEDVGSGARPTSAVSAGDALKQLNAAAEGIQKADGKLTAQQAFAKAAALHPGLYETYVSAQN
jgi:hypothetical protein